MQRRRRDERIAKAMVHPEYRLIAMPRLAVDRLPLGRGLTETGNLLSDRERSARGTASLLNSFPHRLHSVSPVRLTPTIEPRLRQPPRLQPDALASFRLTVHRRDTLRRHALEGPTRLRTADLCLPWRWLCCRRGLSSRQTGRESQ
jgi:hypothetical protein